MYFRLNTLKGTAKAPAEDVLRLNTVTLGIKTGFSTPKKHGEHPCHFIRESPPRSGPRERKTLTPAQPEALEFQFNSLASETKPDFFCRLYQH